MVALYLAIKLILVGTRLFEHPQLSSAHDLFSGILGKWGQLTVSTKVVTTLCPSATLQ